jgi:sigma54-dependent transcription regulator
MPEKLDTQARKRRRQIRIDPSLDAALRRIARQRGHSVTALLEEAARAHFHLSNEASQAGNSEEALDKGGEAIAAIG